MLLGLKLKREKAKESLPFHFLEDVFFFCKNRLYGVTEEFMHFFLCKYGINMCRHLILNKPLVLGD